MCGICGYIALNVRGRRSLDEKVIERMANTIRHRGPDDEGFYLDERAGLASRRLSIVDLEGGRQPIYNEAGDICVVFNGEIYNQTPLRRNLEEQGHVFSTRTDTEVLVHLYEDYGDQCVDHLNGMFAFAIWDAKERRCLLARDRLGIKPLYYADLAGTLVFASEIKALLVFPGVPRRLEPGALDLYLTLRYLPAESTLFAGIHKLLPGHILTLEVETGKCGVLSYWHPPLRVDDDLRVGVDELADELRELLEDSVRIRLMSDVPFGAFLSGGLDSSGVVALMSSIMEEPVKTFSIGFSEEAALDERRYARLVAESCGSEHRELDCTAAKVEILPRLLYHFDEPFADPIIVPTYQFSELASQHVKVVLTGEGADELFGGYARFASDRLLQRYRGLPTPLGRALRFVAGAAPAALRQQVRRGVEMALMEPPERFCAWVSAFNPGERAALYRPELKEDLRCGAEEIYARFAAEWQGVDLTEKMLYTEMKLRLPECMLARMDRMSMAVSLEARTPFLDHRLVERVLALPAQFKIRGKEEKYILKKALARVLPPAIVRRKKQGLAVPFALWTRHGIERSIGRILSREHLRRRGWFDPEYVQGLLGRWGPHAARHSQLVWSLLCLEIWCRIYLDEDRLDPNTPLSQID